jgi:D-alanine-D-alanine ligase
MRIGLVYDLRDEYRAMGYSEEETVEFDSIATIDGLAGALERLGHEVDRIGHAKKLAQRLVLGERWDLVFSIAEGLKGRGREAQVPALLELYDQPYAFSDTVTMALCLDKALTKRVVRDAGIPTAPFMVVETGKEDFSAWTHFPAFIKPLAEGTGKGCELASKVGSRKQLVEAAKAHLKRFRQPALVEAFLPGREFTVGIVGNGEDAKVVGVMEILLNREADQGVYSMRNKEDSETLCTYVRADDAEARLVAERGLAAYRALGCRDSCRIDFRSDAAGSPVFLEANPIAGLHPTHSDLPILSQLNGITYDELLGRILGAAMKRYGLASPQLVRSKRTKAA